MDTKPWVVLNRHRTAFNLFCLDLISNEGQILRSLRRIAGGVGAVAIAYGLWWGVHVPDMTTALVVYSTIIVFAGEGLIRLGTSHSVMGTAARYYFAPQYYFEGVRAFTMNFLVKSIYFITAIITILSIFPQMELKFSVGQTISWIQMAGGFVQLVMTLILSHYSILVLVFTTIGAFSYTLPKYLQSQFRGVRQAITNRTDLPATAVKAIPYENAMPPTPRVLAGLLMGLSNSHDTASHERLPMTCIITSIFASTELPVSRILLPEMN